MSRLPFSGTYRADDVDFLVELVDVPIIGLDEKERLLRGGHCHYSELLGPEHEPSAAYLAAYHAGLQANCARLAADLLVLAHHIDQTHDGVIWLASLARAGTPIGVILVRALRGLFGRTAHHVSLSIVADRGVDAAALDWLRLEAGYRDGAVVFVDGWTGKGTIAGELRRSIIAYNRQRGARLNPTLCVVADLCGATPRAATTEDYLIASALLGAVVSGLLSRTVLPRDRVGRDQWHCARFYDELRPYDRSLAFVDLIEAQMKLLHGAGVADLPQRPNFGDEAVRATEALAAWQVRLGLRNQRFLKPGVGEATRVLLRRLPRLLVVRDAADPDVQHLLLLAKERGVAIQVDARLPWRALASIVEEYP